MKTEFRKALEYSERLCRGAKQGVRRLLSAFRDAGEAPPEPETPFFYPLEAALSSDLGLVRPNNEDNFLLGRTVNETCDSAAEVREFQTDAPGWAWFGVFDGMGGGEFGELAALLSARIFRGVPSDSRLTRRDVERLARDGFRAANRAVLEQKRESMYGTTGTVLCTNGTLFKIFHLGDSRAYLFHDGALTQLTKDQTLAARKAEDGIYAPGDALYEQEKRFLLEYIGCDAGMETLTPAETPWAEFVPGSVILLCSDGLYDMCADAEITEILRAGGTPWEWVRRLTDAAKRNGGEDNITCLAVRRPAESGRNGEESVQS